MKIRFSEAAKANTDIILPTVGAGLAFYYLKEKQNLKMERLLIYTAIAWIVLYLLTSRITKTLRNNTIAPADVPIPSVPDPGTTPNFNASYYSDRLYKDINGLAISFLWGGTGRDNSLYEELSRMTNSELIQVGNQYKRDYYAKTGETLVESLEGEWFNNLFYGTDTRVKGLIDRFRALGF